MCWGVEDMIEDVLKYFRVCLVIRFGKISCGKRCGKWKGVEVSVMGIEGRYEVWKSVWMGEVREYDE